MPDKVIYFNVIFPKRDIAFDKNKAYDVTKV